MQAEKIINGWEYCEKRDCPNLTEILSMINGAPLYQPAQPLPLLHDEDGDEDDGDGLDNEFGALVKAFWLIESTYLACCYIKECYEVKHQFLICARGIVTCLVIVMISRGFSVDGIVADDGERGPI